MMRITHSRSVGMAAMLIACLLIGTGCAGRETVPRDPDRFYNDNFGYSVKFPDKDYRLRVDMTRETNQPKRPMVLEPFTESRLRIQRANLPGFHLIDREPATLGGHKAIRITYIYQKPSRVGPIAMAAMAYFTVRGHRGYVLTCREQSIAFYKFREPFEQIAASFEFLKPTED